MSALDELQDAARTVATRLGTTIVSIGRDGRGSGVAARLLAFYLLRTLKPSLTMRAPRVAAAPLSTPFVMVS